MKKIIDKYVRNPKLVFLYLESKGLLDWLPDKIYLSFMYYLRVGKKINWSTPRTFSEKIQWMKLNYRKEEYRIMVDKYNVRTYVEKVIGADYLIPLLGVWETPDQIDFERLPNEYVLKCTHDSGGVFVVKDKYRIDKEQIINKLRRRLKMRYYKHGREWQYKNVKPKIIAEKLMTNEDGSDLQDYKFFCFNGKVETILVCSDRYAETGLCEDFYDKDWNHLQVRRPNHPNNSHEFPKPSKLKEMIEIAEKLSKNHPFLRVDLYEIREKVYFGEITLYPASGLESFIPQSYDEYLGSCIEVRD